MAWYLAVGAVGRRPFSTPRCIGLWCAGIRLAPTAETPSAIPGAINQKMGTT